MRFPGRKPDVARRRRVVAVDESHKVTPFELFFDLVFVFVMTQVTAYMAHDPSTVRVLEGMVILGVLWWSWTAYSWLGAVARADEGASRLLFVIAMGAVLVLALAIPEAFHVRPEHVGVPGELYPPMVVALCVVLVRLVHFVAFWIAADEDTGLKRQLLRFAVPQATGSVLLLISAFAPDEFRVWLWAAALIADLLLTQLIGAAGWRLRSVGHFAERHGLIIIIALGESIVAVGVGVQDKATTLPVVLAATLSLLIVGSLWWAYFDLVAPFAERLLHGLTGKARMALARDSYSYLHLPMVAGIILLALGLKKVLTAVGEPEHAWEEHLHGPGAVALVLGPALYLLGHIAFRLRNRRSLNKHRTVVVVLLLAAIPVVELVPAFTALAGVATLLALMIGYEAVAHREMRISLRQELVHGSD
ncbi:low temperature requirement protein A [Pseudonocardiaceae bacterium YIM PH 21723]|nr:low temperature requirement protein A [Pseudonocardiaceae bacterium YIM PH 21723]